MAAVKQFYRSVPKKHSLDVAFCLCKWAELIFIKAVTRTTAIANGHQLLYVSTFPGKTETTNNASELKTSSILLVLRLVANMCLQFQRKSTKSITFSIFLPPEPPGWSLLQLNLITILFHLSDSRWLEWRRGKPSVMSHAGKGLQVWKHQLFP